MPLRPIAHFHSPFPTKFGIPRQSGLVPNLHGTIVFEPEYRSTEAIRGIEGYDYLWLIWGFSANGHAAHGLTVRPPRLGGNRRMGVFATRSPFRPNALGLSSVRLVGIDMQSSHAPALQVAGADLMHMTPIYDVKPYLPFTDSHPDARAGFAAEQYGQRLRVEAAPGVLDTLPHALAQTLIDTLAEDPRPQYHDDPGRIYGMPFGQWDVKFSVANGTLTIHELLMAKSNEA